MPGLKQYLACNKYYVRIRYYCFIQFLQVQDIEQEL